MTKKELSQLKYIMFEIKSIEGEIRVLSAALKKKEVATTVTGSSTEFPYTMRIFTIRGVEETRSANHIRKRLSTRRVELKYKHRQAEREYDKLTEYIDNIPDRLVRLIFTYRYREGLSWPKVAGQIKGSNEDSLRILHDRYIEKHRI